MQNPGNRRDFQECPVAGQGSGRHQSACGRTFPVLALAVLTVAASVGCASTSRYTRGPESLAALPEPLIRLGRAPVRPTGTSIRLGIDVEVPELSSEGTVIRLARNPPPAKGFLLRVASDDGSESSVSVGTFVDGMPDVSIGSKVRISTTVEDPAELVIRDERGVVFMSSTGSWVNEEAKDRTVKIRVSPQRVYTEILGTEAGCRLTVNRTRIAASVGEDVRLLDPGGTTVFVVGEDRFLVVAVDSQAPEDSSCAELPDNRVVFMWMRLLAD